MTERERRRMIRLAQEIGGWLYWYDDSTDPKAQLAAWGVRFVPMDEWLLKVNCP